MVLLPLGSACEANFCVSLWLSSATAHDAQVVPASGFVAETGTRVGVLTKLLATIECAVVYLYCLLKAVQCCVHKPIDYYKVALGLHGALFAEPSLEDDQDVVNTYSQGRGICHSLSSGV
jgi:hypothetical protein